MSQKCKTPGALYEIDIRDGAVSCKVHLPPTVKARFNSAEMKVFKDSIHDAMESILAPYFPECKCR
jgi:hypothetical protein